LSTLSASGCGDRFRKVQSDDALRDLVRQRTAAVERATGLTFKRPPVVARRTREQVVSYIVNKLDQDMPPAELEGLHAAARLFGFVADTLDLRRTLLAVLGEQVAGYYDPDSQTLYVAADVADSFMLRTTVAHELVHALQHQYVRVDSIIRLKGQNDRRTAGAAVLEGQATLAQTILMMPELEGQLASLPSFWAQRTALETQQAQMQAYAGAPLWLRETLLFPYLAGADFVRAHLLANPDAPPFDAAMPASTEQILHYERYAAGDAPTELRFSADGDAPVRHEDGLGEFEIRLLFQVLLNDAAGLRAAALAQGWDGDRYQVIRAGPAADALVWYSVWDDAAAADRFARSLERAWPRRTTVDRATRRTRIERLTIGGRPAVRLVDAPPDWRGWRRLPTVTIVGDS
jgi:hypothetical protein